MILKGLPLAQKQRPQTILETLKFVNNTKLRKEFLHILSNFTNCSCTIKLINGHTISNAQIKAIDRECLKIIVTPLRTPSGELPTAILRLTDVTAITLEDVNISEHQDE